MPRAFLVKKTRGAQHERLQRDYDNADFFDCDDLRKTRRVDFHQSIHDVDYGQDLGIRDQQTSQQSHNYSTSFKNKEATVKNTFMKTPSNYVLRGMECMTEPIDLSQVKPTQSPTLHVSAYSTFEHVCPSVHITDEGNDISYNAPNVNVKRDAKPWQHSLSLSTYLAHKVKDEPLDLQVRRYGKTRESESPYSTRTLTPVEVVLPRPWRPNNAYILDKDGIGLDGSASALRSLTSDGSTPRKTNSFQGPDFSRYSTDWRNGAIDGYMPYCKKRERVMVLTSSSGIPVNEGSYDVSRSYLLDEKYMFPTNMNYVSLTNIHQPPTQNTSPCNVNHSPKKSSTQLELQSNLMVQQTNFFRRSEQPQVRTSNKRSARQPILGLEYIQNTPNGHDRAEISNEDTSKEQNVKHFIQEQNQNDPIVLPNHEHTTDLNNTEDTCSSSEKVNPKTTQHKKYICDVCGKGFSRSNTLVTHKRIHTGDKPFKCELCGRAFRQPGNLTRHRLTHTTDKPYVCQQCCKAFNRASNLHTHMRTHTNYKPFICQYCGKGFHQKIDMKIHCYTHTGEKPHKCKKCGRGFKQLTHLTYHMRTHSEIKMYTCTYCGNGFNQKGNLQAHIYGHTGERPYHCEVCNKGFTLASTLNTHRRTHADKNHLHVNTVAKISTRKML